MATYQFKIELIPATWAKNNNNNALLLFEGEQYDLFKAWENYKPQEDLKFCISKILPKGSSWHEDLEVWGDDESSDIKIFWVKQTEQLESISIRLDLREDINEKIRKIIQLAKELHCVFFFPEFKKIVNPEYFSVKEIIDNSQASKWVKDPENYLKYLTDRKK